MTGDEIRSLKGQHNSLTMRINELSKAVRQDMIRAGASFTSETMINGVPARHDHFISMFTAKEITEKFKEFVNSYLEDLIAQRAMIWATLQKIGVVID